MKTTSSKQNLLRKLTTISIIFALMLTLSIPINAAITNETTGETFKIPTNLPQITINEVFSPGERILAVSPDVKTVVTMKSNSISFWDLAHNKRLTTVNIVGNYNSPGSFSPDSSKFIIRSNYSEYLLVDVETLNSSTIKDKMKGDIVAVTADGKNIIATSSPNIYIYDSTTFELNDSFSPGGFYSAIYDNISNTIAILMSNSSSIKTFEINGKLLKTKNFAATDYFIYSYKLKNINNNYASISSSLGPYLIDMRNDEDNVIFDNSSSNSITQLYDDIFLTGAYIISIKDGTVIAKLKSYPIYNIIPDKKLGIGEDKIYDISPLLRKITNVTINIPPMAAIDKTAQISATAIFDDNTTAAVPYNELSSVSSSNNRIITIDNNGTLTANGLGKAIITAEYIGFTATKQIEVVTKVPNVGDVLGDVVYSDITAYINGYAIPTSIIKGRTLVTVEDLTNYGFNVVWNSKAKTLNVELNKNKSFTPLTVKKDTANKPGTFKQNYVYTDIMTYVSSEWVESFAIDGVTLIDFDSLGKFGTFKWDAQTREIRLTIG